MISETVHNLHLSFITGNRAICDTLTEFLCLLHEISSGDMGDDACMLYFSD